MRMGESCGVLKERSRPRLGNWKGLGVGRDSFSGGAGELGLISPIQFNQWRSLVSSLPVTSSIFSLDQVRTEAGGLVHIIIGFGAETNIWDYIQNRGRFQQCPSTMGPSTMGQQSPLGSSYPPSTAHAPLPSLPSLFPSQSFYFRPWKHRPTRPRASTRTPQQHSPRLLPAQTDHLSTYRMREGMRDSWALSCGLFRPYKVYILIFLMINNHSHHHHPHHPFVLRVRRHLAVFVEASPYFELNRYYFNQRMQLGKSLSIVFILLGIYLIYQLLFSGSPIPGPRPSSSEVYHIGCYDLERPINHSAEITLSLSQFQQQHQTHSPEALSKLRDQLDRNRVKYRGANAMARQFEKYIATYESVRSHNQYEQTFFNTLRNTRKAYQDCRADFNERPWECRNLSQKYNDTSDHFNELRERLRGLVERKNKHTQDSVDMLRDDDIKIDKSYSEQYNIELEKLNGRIIRREREIGDVIATLNALKLTIGKKEGELNLTLSLLKKCQTNTKQIEYCKNISEFLTQIYPEQELQLLEQQMLDKKKVIEMYKTTMVQSKKLGEDVTDYERKIQRLTKEYMQLQNLYDDTLNASKCALDWKTQCQPETIKNYQKNITSLNKELHNLNNNRVTLETQLTTLQQQLRSYQDKTQQLQEEMKNQVIDIDYLKSAEAKKKKEVERYREALNDIRIEIAQVKAELADTHSIRVQQNQDIDLLMGRGEELIDCLGKKSLYQQLGKRKPRERPEDEEMKRRVASELGARVRDTLPA